MASMGRIRLWARLRGWIFEPPVRTDGNVSNETVKGSVGKCSDGV